MISLIVRNDIEGVRSRLVEHHLRNWVIEGVLALSNSNTEIAAMIFSKVTKRCLAVTAEDLITLLHVAAAKQLMPTVEPLIERVDSEKELLVALLKEGEIEMAEYAFAHFKNANLVLAEINLGGFASDASIPELQFLLNKGIDINKRNFRGETPLMWAAWRGAVKAVKFLLAEGADFNLKTHSGSTALDYATRQNEDVCAALIKEAMTPRQAPQVEESFPLVAVGIDSFNEQAKKLAKDGYRPVGTTLITEVLGTIVCAQNFEK